MLSVKQGGIRYHFLSLWYDSTLDWIQVFRAIEEHSNHYANLRWIRFLSQVKIFWIQFSFSSIGCLTQDLILFSTIIWFYFLQGFDSIFFNNNGYAN